MQPLIKITSEPIQVVRFSQGARLVSSDHVDIERRKALARQASMRSSAGQGTISVEDIKKINRTFSKKQAKVQASDTSFQQQVVSRHAQVQAQSQAQMSSSVSVSQQMASADAVIAETASAVSVVAAAPVVERNISMESSSSYTAQRGSFEMRVAKGDLTYLPPMVMTIVTQRPQVHIEYLGGFNYVPPRRADAGNTVNLFT